MTHKIKFLLHFDIQEPCFNYVLIVGDDEDDDDYQYGEGFVPNDHNFMYYDIL